jgi:copper(I)-binding protein
LRAAPPARAPDARLKSPAAFLVACLLVPVAALVAATTSALLASDAWLRATPGTEVAAVYLTVRNTGTEPVTIVGVRSPMAQSAMIHESQVSGTQSTMRPRAALTVAPGQTLRFEPGGLHVMLHLLTHTLSAGEQVPLVLLLQDGGTLDVSAHVRALQE